MKGTYLGEFEELVLLTVGILNGEAYGVKVMDEIDRNIGRRVSVSTVHTTLNRLEKKGMIHSFSGPASAVRGGRSKRLYRINQSGNNALAKVKMQREKLWTLLPKKYFGNG